MDPFGLGPNAIIGAKVIFLSLAYGQSGARGDVAFRAETGDISAKNSSIAPQGLTLAPSGDESLPVRFQEPQTNAFPVKPKSNLSPSVPLGMEFILHRK